ncbi:MAG: phenylacetate--CoA ligase family protein [Rhodocyclales bacterium]|nr:phenylacetate--CoA ligase family protein [Rhodocyclales bacterium]
MGFAASHELKSAVFGVSWPGIPSPEGAALLALQYQFEHSQWLPLAQIEAKQFRQLREVLAHAAQTVPYHRDRLRAAGIDPDRDIDPAAFARLPLLTRRDVQRQGAALLSQAPPRGHGELVEHKTSGSSGEPLRVFGTQLDTNFWLAQTLRDHLWHRREFAGKLCAIRSRVNDMEMRGWGPATDALFATGPSALLNIRADPAQQLEWLQQHNPDYLLSHPTNLRELARLSLREGVKLPRLRQVRSFGEALPHDLRTLCREAWGVGVVDVYSAEEVGYIALQCPGHEHYHLQSEHLLIEILDPAGRPCAPGAVGRVVVTTLHNFAMPLLRYALDDYAEVGAACACGRGLPVLTRILGRSRNMLTLPDGRRYWPSFPEMRYAAASIRQLQIIQHTRGMVEARFVAERGLQAEEERALIAAIRDALGYPFAVTLTPVAEIRRPPSMKYEDIVSLVAADDETVA